MTFGLRNTPTTTFQCMIQEIFYDNLTEFMRVFVDDFSVFDRFVEHLHQLCLCALERCMRTKLKLNPLKCAFVVVRGGTLLRHIVSKEGIYVVPEQGQDDAS